MNNSNVTQKYINKYLTEAEKWNFIVALLKKHNKIKNRIKLKHTVQRDLQNLSNADECYFTTNENTTLTGEIMLPVATSEKVYGTLILKSNKPNFKDENVYWIQIVADNFALMLENIELIEDLRLKNQNQMDFLASVSHEFKTPLNSIMGFTNLLKEKNIQQENHKYLENISQSSKFLMTLIQDILDVTRSKYKKLELNREFLRPKNVINEILSELGEQISEKNITVSVTHSNVIINADMKRFRQ